MNQLFVGKDVVCIDAKQPANTTLPSELIEEQIYKIRWVGIHKHYLDGEYVGVRLEGIDRGTCKIWGDEDTPFRATRFRPLVADRLGSLRALLVPNQPLAPSIEEPRIPDEKRQPTKPAVTTPQEENVE